MNSLARIYEMVSSFLKEGIKRDPPPVSSSVFSSVSLPSVKFSCIAMASDLIDLEKVLSDAITSKSLPSVEHLVGLLEQQKLYLEEEEEKGGEEKGGEESRGRKGRRERKQRQKRDRKRRQQVKGALLKISQILIVGTELACSSGCLDIMCYLQSRNPSVTNHSLMCIAIKNQKFDVIDHLVNKGLRMTKSATYLCLAIEVGVEMVKFLLDKGADPRVSKSTALIKACEYDSLEMVKMLLVHDADPTTKNGQPLMIAIENSSLPIIEILVKNGALTSSIAQRVFYKAVNFGNYDVLRLLINNRVDFNVSGRRGLALLHALIDKNYDVARMLLCLEIDFKPRECEVLITVVKNGNLDLLKKLGDRGVDLRFEDDYLLRSAVSHKKLDIVMYLVEKGADVKAKGGDALTRAMKHKDHKIRDYLLSLGVKNENPEICKRHPNR